MKLNLIFLSLVLVVTSGCVAATTGMNPYRLETVTTITGVVDNSETVMNKQTKEPGFHLSVTTASDTFVVHVSPQWYADKMNIKFSKGEQLTITGSTFTKDFKQNIYAATIVGIDNSVLNLRNPDTGESLWVGRTRDEDLPQRDLAQQEQNQKKKKESMLKSKKSSTIIRDGSNKGIKSGGLGGVY